MSNLLTNKYTFSCGCSLDIIDDTAKEYDNLPKLRIDYYSKINYNCKDTWSLITSGKTKGIFQLESALGKRWSQILKPNEMEDLSALGSLLRPGCLRAMLKDKDGNEKSLTQHFCDRKNKSEDVEFFHISLKPILKFTLGIMIYQEQALKMATDIAGFSLVEADLLRNAIGKKKADEMAALEKKFVDGCERVGIVSREEGQQIFDWIKESQRYSFNRCLSPSTIVETKDGFKTLDELKVGEYILDNDEEFIEVIDKIDQGMQEMYEVELESGHTIECTLSHKFLCSDNVMRPLSEILEKDLGILCDN